MTRKATKETTHNLIASKDTVIKKVLDYVPALVAVYRIDTGEYIYVGDSLKKILGYAPRAFIKGGFSFAVSLVHPDDLPRIIDENNRALKKANSKRTSRATSEPIVTFEYRMRHKNGTWKWLHSDGVVFERTVTGKVLSVMNVSVDITARKEQELAARNQLETVNTRIQDIFDRISDGFAAFDKDWRFIYVNKNIEHILGKNRRQLIGKNIWHEYPQAVGTPLYQKYLRAMHSTKPKVFEEYSVISNRWFRIHTSPTKDGLSLYARDITEQKEAEAEFRYHAGLINAISDAIVSTDMQFMIRSFNKAAEKLYGYKEKEVLGKPATEIIPTELVEKGTDFRSDIVKKGYWRGEVKQKRRDGSTVYILASISLVKDNKGNPIGAITVNRDITDRREAEDTLRRSQAQFQAIYDANIIGILYCDLSGTIFDANDAFLRMIGYSRKELKQGKLNWDSLTPSEHSPSDEKAIKELLAKGVATLWEKEYFRKDGTRIPVIAGAALLNSETTETIAFVFDISERKQLEQRKDEFISIASHELKTPITSIKAFAQLLLLQSKKESNSKSLPILQRMDDQLNRLTKLVNDLLDVSRIQTGKLALNRETFSLDDLAKEIIVNIQLLSKTHAITVKGRIGTAFYGDKDRIGQVLTNLINNAIAYSPQADKIVIGLRKVGDHAEISVKDFGIGIAKEHQEKIFKRFYRAPKTHNRLQGQGLGLYIVSEIIKRHHGTISVESELNKGTTFTITLPLR